MQQPDRPEVPRRRNSPVGGQRPQRIRLPFEKRKTDVASWTYEHRVGLCCMVIAYLIFGIAFVSAKIAMNAKPTDTMIYVDLTEMLKEQPQEQEQQQQAKDEDYRSLRNKVSDVNGGDQSVGKMIERAQADGQRAAQNGKMDLDQDLSDEAEAV